MARYKLIKNIFTSETKLQDNDLFSPNNSCNKLLLTGTCGGHVWCDPSTVQYLSLLLSRAHKSSCPLSPLIHYKSDLLTRSLFSFYALGFALSYLVSVNYEGNIKHF